MLTFVACSDENTIMKMVNLLTEKVIDINYEAPDGMNALSVSSKMHLKSTPIDTCRS
jgi:hypothetical protein